MAEEIHVQPTIRVLSPEAIDRIHADSLHILSEIGIRIDSVKARLILKASRYIHFRDDLHAMVDPEIVEWAIHQAPATIDIYTRTGDLCFRLGEDHTRFGIGVTNLFYQDSGTREIVPFTRTHMRSSVGLGNKLDSYDVISTIGILRDVNPASADLVAILEMVAGTVKPLVILVSDEKQFEPVVMLLENLCGDRSSTPFVIPYFNPVTPLILNQSTADNMLAAIKHGLPIIFSNYGMAGVSTPITSLGILAIMNAELLAGLVFSQLAKPGAPVILGSLPAYFDMKSMVDFYDPRTMLLNLACAEMMAYYHIPHAGTSGSSNGYGADLIASQALTINQLTSCLGKVGLAPFVGGSFGSKVFSPELVVYVNEMIEQSRQFAAGFEISEAELGLDEMVKTSVGGNFISSRQTMKKFRSAYHSSSIFPRLSLEKWRETGQPEASSLLREHTLSLLNQPRFPDDQHELLQKGEFLLDLSVNTLH